MKTEYIYRYIWSQNIYIPHSVSRDCLENLPHQNKGVNQERGHEIQETENPTQ